MILVVARENIAAQLARLLSESGVLRQTGIQHSCLSFLDIDGEDHVAIGLHWP